jgi:hypothetical protein
MLTSFDCGSAPATTPEFQLQLRSRAARAGMVPRARSGAAGKNCPLLAAGLVGKDSGETRTLLQQTLEPLFCGLSLDLV